jgi:hypothetical protein
LDELGIQSLDAVSESASDDQGNGNAISATGSFTWEDGNEGLAGTGNAADIDFSVDTFHSNFTDTIELAEGVEALPDRSGSGLVRSSFLFQIVRAKKTSRRQYCNTRV